MADPTDIHDLHVFNCILNAIEKVTGIGKEKIQSRSRRKEIVDARRIAIIYMRRETALQIAIISKCLSLHHSSVVHNTAKHNDLIETDKNYQMLVKKIHHEYVMLNPESTTSSQLEHIRELIKDLSAKYKRVKNLMPISNEKKI